MAQVFRAKVLALAGLVLLSILHFPSGLVSTINKFTDMVGQLKKIVLYQFSLLLLLLAIGCKESRQNIDKLEILMVDPDILTPIAISPARFKDAFSEFDYRTVILNEKNEVKAFIDNIKKLSVVKVDLVNRLNIRANLKFYNGDEVILEVFVGKQYTVIDDKIYNSSKFLIDYIRSQTKGEWEILPILP